MRIDTDASEFLAFLNDAGTYADTSSVDAEVLHGFARSIASGRRAPAPVELAQSLLAKVDLQLRIGSTGGTLCLSLLPLNSGSRDSALRALLSSLAMYQADSFQLRRCFYDGQWFVPGVRSARSKFCSAKCRNRFNYELREQDASFICSGCNVQYTIDNFSGFALSNDEPHLAVVHAVSALCASCVLQKYPDWHGYIADAELVATGRDDGSSALNDRATEIVSAIILVLSQSPQPLHYKQIATAISHDAKISRRSADLTVLGYLMRHADKFTQVASHTFSLNRQYANKISAHSPNAVENGAIE